MGNSYIQFSSSHIHEHFILFGVLSHLSPRLLQLPPWLHSNQPHNSSRMSQSTSPDSPCFPLHTLPPEATWIQNHTKPCPWQSELHVDPLGAPMVHLHRSTTQSASLPSHHWPQGMPLPLTHTVAANPGAFYLPLAAVCPEASCLFHNCLLLLKSWQDFANSVAV